MSDEIDHLTIDAWPAVRGLRLTLRQLQFFVATAGAGSTRAAADRVARSQSATSAALVELETALGVPLFDRIGRRLALNENGRALLPKATALVEQAAELQQLFTRGPSGPLRVAASLTIGEYVLPGLVTRWTAEHPDSLVQLRIGNSSEVLAAVAAFEVDVGFVEGPQTHPELVSHPWLLDELVVVAAPAHPLAGGATRRQLRDAAWALREPGSGTREVADRWLLEHVGATRVAFELGSAESIKRVVGAGAALGFLSQRAVAAELARGELVAVRTRLPPARRRLAWVLHRHKRLGRGAQAFVAFCETASP